MPPKPPGPNSDEICGNYYEEQMDPAHLVSMARDLAQAGTQILATAEEGPAKIATQLAPHGQGVLATSLISKWTQFFAQLHLPAAQFTAASAGVTAIAGIINATSIEQANVWQVLKRSSPTFKQPVRCSSSSESTSIKRSKLSKSKLNSWLRR